MYIILSMVKVAEWPPFWKELLIPLTVCYLFVILIISHFGFEGRFLVLIVLIVQVPGHCLLCISV